MQRLDLGSRQHVRLRAANNHLRTTPLSFSFNALNQTTVDELANVGPI